MPRKYTFEDALKYSDRAIKENRTKIRKAIHDAAKTGSTVPFSLSTLIDSGVSINVIRKVYRKGAG